MIIKRLDAAAMVAGNVWNAGVVLGAPVTDWAVLDLAQMTACLSINGRAIGNGKGKGGDVMGHPTKRPRPACGQTCGGRDTVAARHDRHDRQHGPDPMPGRRRPVLVEISGLGTAELAVT